MGNVRVVVVLLLLSLPAFSCLEWSGKGLHDGTTIRACPGSDVVFTWVLNTTPTDSIADIQWYYHGNSQEMVAMLVQGRLLILPAFSGRVSEEGNAGIRLSNVSTGDSGNYSVEVLGASFEAGSVIRLRRSVVLHVAEAPSLLDRDLEATLSPRAAYDRATGNLQVELRCGQFTHLGDPPVGVTWQKPSGAVEDSTDYVDGFFTLRLPSPVEAGVYICQTRPQALDNDTSSGMEEVACPGLMLEADVAVNGTDARLAVLEAENADLRQRLQDNSCGQNQSYVGFYAMLHDDVTLLNNQRLSLGYTLTNDGGAYNGTLGYFTAPSSGTYAFIANSAAAEEVHLPRIAIVTEDRVTHWIGSGRLSRHSMSVSYASAVLPLAKGDRVWTVCDESRCQFYSSLTYFAGFRVGP